METGKSISLLASVAVLLSALLVTMLMHRPIPIEKETIKSEPMKKYLVSSFNHKQRNFKFENSQGRGRGVGSKDFAARVDECKEWRMQSTSRKPRFEEPAPSEPRSEESVPRKPRSEGPAPRKPRADNAVKPMPSTPSLANISPKQFKPRGNDARHHLGGSLKFFREKKAYRSIHFGLDERSFGEKTVDVILGFIKRSMY